MDGDRGAFAEFGKKRNTDYDFSPHSQINLWGRKIIFNLYFSISLYGANGGDRVGQKH